MNSFRPFSGPFTATAVVLSWEDVLMPTTTLAHRIGLQPTRTGLDAATALFQSDEYLQQALRAIEEQAINLIREASRFGPVFIVSHRSAEYLSAVCARFFPCLALWLSSVNVAAARGERFHVQVVTGPRKFASQAEAVAWRVRTYQSICRAVAGGYGRDNNNNEVMCVKEGERLLRFRESGSIALLSISGCEADRFACLKAVDVAPFVVPKCVHVHGSDAPAATGGSPFALGLEEFFAQLRTLARYLTPAAEQPNAFAVNL
jgi:hypothetical protein